MYVIKRKVIINIGTKVQVRTRRLEANGKRIAGIAVSAGTDRIVFDDSAIGISAAGAGTGILAFLIHASERERTVRARHAFGATCGWATDVVRQTRTDRLVVINATLTVGPARRWIADILRSFNYNNC